jgi:CheY-like chemotaxis protein
MVKEFMPYVIILDVDLPGRDGYEVARMLRKNKCRALLIALTGHYGKREDKAKARAAGFDHHLTRPVLVAEVEKLFSAPR